MLTADHIVSRHRKPVRQPRQYHMCVCCSQPRFDQHNNRHNLQTDHRQERQKGTSIKVQSWRSSNNHLRLSSTTYVVRRPTTFSMASTIGHQKGSFFLFPFCEVKDYKGLCYVSFYQTLSTSSKTAMISDPPLRPRRL